MLTDFIITNVFVHVVALEGLVKVSDHRVLYIVAFTITTYRHIVRLIHEPQTKITMSRKKDERIVAINIIILK